MNEHAMAKFPKNPVIIGVALGLAIALVCGGFPILFFAPLFQKDRYSDQYATVGEMIIPINALNVHASNPHYIRVAGKTYKYSDGVAPGYFLVPQLNAMIFMTSASYFDGPRTIHVRDLATGEVTDISENGFRTWLVDQASCQGCNERWWIHERVGQTVTFGLFGTYEGGSHLQFTKIDFAKRVVTDVPDYWFKPDGSFNALMMSDHPAVPSGTTLDGLIGSHREEAGLPPTKPN